MTDYINEYLWDVLESHRMVHVTDLLENYREKRREVKEFLKNEYGSNIYEAFSSGSYKKHTAINTKFDLDLVVPFKYNAFQTLELMFDDIYIKLNEKYKNESTVKRQGVSIGLSFEVDDEINIDIVPARETSNDSFKDKKDLNLHKSDGSGYLKTNIHNQIDHIKARENERKVIRLLKIWKFNHNQNYKSFFIELLVIKAYDKTVPDGTIWEQLKTVLVYARDHIDNENFTLLDPGNSNNNLMNSIDNVQKSNLIRRFDNMLNQIEQNEANIELYFYKNQNVIQDISENNKRYGLKSKLLASIPPSTQRFG